MPRFVILTAGFTNPHTAKTAVAMLRYRGCEVEALLDGTQAGRTAGELLGVGGETPIVGSLSEVPAADALLIGIAPPGGRIPPAWRAVILEACQRGMQVVSGLHEFLCEDAEFSAAAAAGGAELIDLRRNTNKQIARRTGLREECLRILTVGNDCSVGKMVASLEIARGLVERGVDARFLATGQTGILLAGTGVPVDAVVADFVSGAVEQMVLANHQHEVLVIEGQGSLVHPSYSGVTLSLLHGAFPHGLILVYEVGRTAVAGLPQVALPQLAEVIRLNEAMGGLYGRPCPVIGVAMNSRLVSAEEAEAERAQREAELGLPVCDVFRHGTGKLVEAVLKLKDERAAAQGD